MRRIRRSDRKSRSRPHKGISEKKLTWFNKSIQLNCLLQRQEQNVSVWRWKTTSPAGLGDRLTCLETDVICMFGTVLFLAGIVSWVVWQCILCWCGLLHGFLRMVSRVVWVWGVVTWLFAFWGAAWLDRDSFLGCWGLFLNYLGLLGMLPGMFGFVSRVVGGCYLGFGGCYLWCQGLLPGPLGTVAWVLGSRSYVVKDFHLGFGGCFLCCWVLLPGLSTPVWMTSSRVNPLGVSFSLRLVYISGVSTLAMWLLCLLRSGYSCSEE